MSLISDALARMFSSRAEPTLLTLSSRPTRSGEPGSSFKGSVVGPLIAYQNLGEPVWAPRDYTAFAREGFMQNAIVYRSVRMIAEAAASIPLLL